MAQEKQDWKGTLHAEKQKRNRQNDSIDPRQKKKNATLMYNKRKLDKDVRNYTDNARRINSRDIDAIGRHYGFHISGTQGRED